MTEEAFSSLGCESQNSNCMDETVCGLDVVSLVFADRQCCAAQLWASPARSITLSLTV